MFKIDALFLFSGLQIHTKSQHVTPTSIYLAWIYCAEFNPERLHILEAVASGQIHVKKLAVLF